MLARRFAEYKIAVVCFSRGTILYYEFDPLSPLYIETSSQVGGDEHLDITSDICGEILQNKPVQGSKLDDGLDNTVEQILLARGKPNPIDADLINLDETMKSDQEHNYLKEDKNENGVHDGNPLKA